MTDLQFWYQSSRPTGVFRTEDFRIWFDNEQKRFCLAYRSPLWSRLPVRTFKYLFEATRAMGMLNAYNLAEVKGTIKR